MKMLQKDEMKDPKTRENTTDHWTSVGPKTVKQTWICRKFIGFVDLDLNKRRNCQKLLVEGCGAAGHGKQAGSPQCHEHPGATQQLRGCTGARELGLGPGAGAKAGPQQPGEISEEMARAGRTVPHRSAPFRKAHHEL